MHLKQKTPRHSDRPLRSCKLLAVNPINLPKKIPQTHIRCAPNQLNPNQSHQEAINSPVPKAINLESLLLSSPDFARRWIKTLVLQATSTSNSSQDVWCTNSSSVAL
jgi:hypothetical protein